MSNYYGNNDHYGSGGQGGDRGNYGGRYGNNNNYNNYNRGNPYGQGRDRYNRGDNSNRMQWPRNSIKQEPQESPFPAHPSVKHDDEWKKREQNLQMLLQCSDQEKKYKEYMELSEEDKRRVFLPGQIGGNDLPIAKHLPSNWDDTVEYAVKQTKERMAKQGWIHNGNGGNNNEGQCYDSDNYSEDSADADYREAGNAKNKSVSGAEIFLKGLTYCPPMTNGFHIILANSDWCCCPCDDRMKNTWMEVSDQKHSYLKYNPCIPSKQRCIFCFISVCRRERLDL